MSMQCAATFNKCSDDAMQTAQTCGSAYDSVKTYPTDCRNPPVPDENANCVDVRKQCLRRINCSWSPPESGYPGTCTDGDPVNDNGDEIRTEQDVKGDPGCLQPTLPNGMPNPNCAPPVITGPM